MGLFKRSGYWHDVTPTGAIGDLLAVWRQADHNRWRIAVLAACVTTAIFSMMWQEGASGPPASPQITYITAFAPGRSDAQILASNRANQHVQDVMAALQARREADVRDMYKAVGRASGMDVDAIDRKARADAAAQAQTAADNARRRVAAARQAAAIARLEGKTDTPAR